MPLSDEFPLVEDHPDQQQEPKGSSPDSAQLTEVAPNEETGRTSREMDLVLRYGLHAAALILVVLIGWAARYFYVEGNLQEARLPQQAALAAPDEAAAPAVVRQEDEEGDVVLPEPTADEPYQQGIRRRAVLHTTIPTRPRVDVITYTVKTGDTVFGIAELFGLRPETIFWGNQETPGDDPHRLYVDQVLNILPVDGVYHKWSAGEDIDRVAEFYGVDAVSILEWPGNDLDIFDLNISTPEIDPGSWLIVPGGERELVDFGPPRITRDNPAVASTYGPGHCGSVLDGAVGTGTFVWPTTERYLSGYDWSPATNHHGIDIAGDTGNPIFAADTGVVVYAGWSYFGYGNLVVIDHGQWQTLYAHLSDYYVTCGMSVFQGATIAALGNTGNSSGSHLHFELMYLSAKVNPWDYLSP